MYEQVEKPKENKNRAVANAVAQKKRNGYQGFGFVDNRKSSSLQLMQKITLNKSIKAIQHKENTNSRRAIQETNSKHSEQSIQRYAYIKDKQVIEHYEGVENYPNVMDTTVPIKNLNAKASEYLGDRYYRKYQNKEEFDKHTGGEPVDVGLIDHLALWYRLPFSSGFFVLGEAHNIANYRRLIEESNQNGNILGEGGTAPVLHYSKSRNDRQGEQPTRQTGNATEFAMESIVAKTAYALASLREDIKSEAKRVAKRKKGTRGSTVKKEKLEKDTWLRLVENGSETVKRGKDKKPYFVKQDKTKVYMTPKKVVKEGNYSRNTTATKMLVKCNKSLEVYQEQTVGEMGSEDLGVREFQNMLEDIINIYEKYNQLTPKEKRQIYWGKLKDATNFAILLAKNEIEESTIQRDNLSGETLIGKQAKENPTKTLLGHSCTLRDVFMFEAIEDAKRRGFIMAGIGDDHLQHLRGPLSDKNIRNISYKEFFDSTTNAIHP